MQIQPARIVENGCIGHISLFDVGNVVHGISPQHGEVEGVAAVIVMKFNGERLTGIFKKESSAVYKPIFSTLLFLFQVSFLQ